MNNAEVEVEEVLEQAKADQRAENARRLEEQRQELLKIYNQNQKRRRHAYHIADRAFMFFTGADVCMALGCMVEKDALGVMIFATIAFTCFMVGNICDAKSRKKKGGA